MDPAAKSWDQVDIAANRYRVPLADVIDNPQGRWGARKRGPLAVAVNRCSTGAGPVEAGGGTLNQPYALIQPPPRTRSPS